MITLLEKESSKSKILAVFLFTGFFLPVGFSLSLFFVRTFFVDIEYLKEKLIDINFLGVVKFTKDNLSIGNKSLHNELLKRIYHNLNMLIPKSEDGKTIMITSCIKNEGKTHTAYNLSTFLASRGEKVVLDRDRYTKP